jgi:hypothetical protein
VPAQQHSESERQLVKVGYSTQSMSNCRSEVCGISSNPKLWVPRRSAFLPQWFLCAKIPMLIPS